MDWTTVLDNLDKGVTIVAIITGGTWAYYHFIRGRTYNLRLESAVSGSAECVGGETYIVATAKLKNVGLSKVEVEPVGSGLLFYKGTINRTEKDDSGFHRVEWEALGALPVFENHAWIESGEPISEEQMVVVPGCDKAPFEVALRIVSHGISFSSMTIVRPASDERDSRSGQRDAGGTS